MAREEKKKSKSRLSDVTQSSIKEKWSKRKPLNLDRIMDGLREVNLHCEFSFSSVFLIYFHHFLSNVHTRMNVAQRTLNGDPEPNIWSIKAGPSAYPARKFCSICGGEG